jgi:hypothetical protein
MKVSKRFGIGFLLISAISLGVLASNRPQDDKPTQQNHTLYTYHKDVMPLLQANCNPCHFPGGKVYQKLPFDDSLTVAKLGKKLNTRLKKKEQQDIINDWVKK